MKTLNKLLQVSVVSVVFFITSLLILVFVGSQLFSLLQLSLVAKEVRADWYEINTLSNDLMYMRIDSIDRLETTEEKLWAKITSFENDFRSLEKNNYVRSLSEETRDELVHARCIWNFSRQRLEKALLFIDLAIIGNVDFQEQIYKSDTKTVLETLILFWNSPNLTYQEKFPYRQLKANISVFDYIADEFSQIIDMADKEILPLVKKQITFWILLIFLIFAGAASYLYISLVKTLQPFQRLTKKIASIGSTDIQIFQPDQLSAKEKIGEEDDEVAIIGMGVQRLTSRIHSLYQQVISTETEKRDSQLKALQYQINPHFIYNTLG
ncbi:MAG TPA: histidine kinase, partial [Sphaerochaeta sp.]|nr:histidine kinase [Sphaerochaeta sp.]